MLSSSENEDQACGSTKEDVLDFTSPFLFSDAVLIVRGKHLHCHRAILSLYSPVFKAMFQNRCIENEKNEVVIPLDEYDDIKEMLRHLYTPGGCELTADVAERLIPILHRYQIDSLVNLSERTLSFRLNDSTSATYLRIADLYGLTRLRQAALESCARLDLSKLHKVLEDVGMTAELKNEILERRVTVLEKCLLDILQSFNHSCSRMESRVEGVPSNHCSVHNRPLSFVTLPVSSGENQTTTPQNQAQNPPSTTQTMLISAITTNNNSNVSEQTEVNLATVNNQPAPEPLAVCPQCVDRFKTHVQELCKRGLHKIPIINCRNT